MNTSCPNYFDPNKITVRVIYDNNKIKKTTKLNHFSDCHLSWNINGVDKILQTPPLSITQDNSTPLQDNHTVKLSALQVIFNI